MSSTFAPVSRQKLKSDCLSSDWKGMTTPLIHRSSRRGRIAVWLLVAAVATVSLKCADAHGYLSQPRSRQLYSAQEGKDWCSDPSQCYSRETEPQSASLLATDIDDNLVDFCGTIKGRTYSYPVNMAGESAPMPIQGGPYTAGSTITVDAVFTAFHGGHVEFYICDQPDNLSEECFNKRKLSFSSDIPYYDESYPERLYLDPREASGNTAQHGLIIPSDLECERCVLRWLYVTANSCLPPGYLDAPAGAVKADRLQALRNNPCPYPYDKDGSNPTPERFWNCADISVVAADGRTPSPTPVLTPSPTSGGTPSPTPSPTAFPTPSPTSAPTPSPTASPPVPPNGQCNAMGEWDECFDMSSGPCKNTAGLGAPAGFCFPLDPDTGACWPGTEPCSEMNQTPAPTPSPTTAAPTPSPPATAAPTTAPTPTPAPTPSPTKPECVSECTWDGCVGGSAGPCKNLVNNVCYSYVPGGKTCWGGTTACTSTCGPGSSPSPTPAATPSPTSGPQSPTPAPTAAPTPAPTVPGITQAPTPTNPEGKKFVMYYESWATYERGFPITAMDAATITHINFAFANIVNGRCAVGDSWADLQKDGGHFSHLQALKASHPHLRTLISVGGWTWSSHFSTVASTEQARATFADSCVEFMVQHGFDGIDIDWEYPVQGGLTPSNNPADKDNYTLLLKALRERLDTLAVAERPLLTIASAANPAYVDNMDIPELDEVLDWINIMSYDYNGAWQPVAAHNAPLYTNSDPSNPAPGWNVQNTIDTYLHAGLRPSKVVVGMETIGRSWQGIPDGLFSRCSSSSCPGQGTWEAGVLDYKDIANNYVNQNGYVRYWDDESKVPYLYDSASDIFISYDDEESICEKSNFVVDRGLGGAMVWAASSDRNFELQHVIHRRVLDDSPCTPNRRKASRRMMA